MDENGKESGEDSSSSENGAYQWGDDDDDEGKRLRLNEMKRMRELEEGPVLLVPSPALEIPDSFDIPSVLFQPAEEQLPVMPSPGITPPVEVNPKLKTLLDLGIPRDVAETGLVRYNDNTQRVADAYFGGELKADDDNDDGNDDDNDDDDDKNGGGEGMGFNFGPVEDDSIYTSEMAATQQQQRVLGFDFNHIPAPSQEKIEPKVSEAPKWVSWDPSAKEDHAVDWTDTSPKRSDELATWVDDSDKEEEEDQPKAVPPKKESGNSWNMNRPTSSSETVRGATTFSDSRNPQFSYQTIARRRRGRELRKKVKVRKSAGEFVRKDPSLKGSEDNIKLPESFSDSDDDDDESDDSDSDVEYIVEVKKKESDNNKNDDNNNNNENVKKMESQEKDEDPFFTPDSFYANEENSIRFDDPESVPPKFGEDFVFDDDDDDDQEKEPWNQPLKKEDGKVEEVEEEKKKPGVVEDVLYDDDDIEDMGGRTSEEEEEDDDDDDEKDKKSAEDDVDGERKYKAVLELDESKEYSINEILKRSRMMKIRHHPDRLPIENLEEKNRLFMEIGTAEVYLLEKARKREEQEEEKKKIHEIFGTTTTTTSDLKVKNNNNNNNDDDDDDNNESRNDTTNLTETSRIQDELRELADHFAEQSRNLTTSFTSQPSITDHRSFGVSTNFRPPTDTPQQQQQQQQSDFSFGTSTNDTFTSPVPNNTVSPSQSSYPQQEDRKMTSSSSSSSWGNYEFSQQQQQQQQQKGFSSFGKAPQDGSGAPQINIWDNTKETDGMESEKDIRRYNDLFVSEAGMLWKQILPKSVTRLIIPSQKKEEKIRSTQRKFHNQFEMEKFTCPFTQKEIASGAGIRNKSCGHVYSSHGVSEALGKLKPGQTLKCPTFRCYTDVVLKNLNDDGGRDDDDAEKERMRRRLHHLSGQLGFDEKWMKVMYAPLIVSEETKKREEVERKERRNRYRTNQLPNQNQVRSLYDENNHDVDDDEYTSRTKQSQQNKVSLMETKILIMDGKKNDGNEKPMDIEASFPLQQGPVLGQPSEKKVYHKKRFHTISMQDEYYGFSPLEITLKNIEVLKKMKEKRELDRFKEIHKPPKISMDFIQFHEEDHFPSEKEMIQEEEDDDHKKKEDDDDEEEIEEEGEEEEEIPEVMYQWKNHFEKIFEKHDKYGKGLTKKEVVFIVFNFSYQRNKTQFKNAKVHFRLEDCIRCFPKSFVVKKGGGGVRKYIYVKKSKKKGGGGDDGESENKQEDDEFESDDENDMNIETLFDKNKTEIEDYFSILGIEDYESLNEAELIHQVIQKLPKVTSSQLTDLKKKDLIDTLIDTKKRKEYIKKLKVLKKRRDTYDEYQKKNKMRKNKREFVRRFESVRKNILEDIHRINQKYYDEDEESGDDDDDDEDLLFGDEDSSSSSSDSSDHKNNNIDISKKKKKILPEKKVISRTTRTKIITTTTRRRKKRRRRGSHFYDSEEEEEQQQEKVEKQEQQQRQKKSDEEEEFEFDESDVTTDVLVVCGSKQYKCHRFILNQCVFFRDRIKASMIQASSSSFNKKKKKKNDDDVVVVIIDKEKTNNEKKDSSSLSKQQQEEERQNGSNNIVILFPLDCEEILDVFLMFLYGSESTHLTVIKKFFPFDNPTLKIREKMIQKRMKKIAKKKNNLYVTNDFDSEFSDSDDDSYDDSDSDDEKYKSLRRLFEVYFPRLRCRPFNFYITRVFYKMGLSDQNIMKVLRIADRFNINSLIVLSISYIKRNYFFTRMIQIANEQQQRKTTNHNNNNNNNRRSSSNINNNNNVKTQRKMMKKENMEILGLLTDDYTEKVLPLETMTRLSKSLEIKLRQSFLQWCIKNGNDPEKLHANYQKVQKLDHVLVNQSFYPQSFFRAYQNTHSSSSGSSSMVIIRFPRIRLQNYMSRVFKTRNNSSNVASQADFSIECVYDDLQDNNNNNNYTIDPKLRKKKKKILKVHKYLLFSYLFRRKGDNNNNNNSRIIPLEEKYTERLCQSIFDQAKKMSRKNKNNKSNERLTLKSLKSLNSLRIEGVGSETIEMFISFLYLGRLSKTMDTYFSPRNKVSEIMSIDETESDDESDSDDEDDNNNSTSKKKDMKYNRQVIDNVLSGRIDKTRHQQQQTRLDQYQKLFDFSVAYLSQSVNSTVPQRKRKNCEISMICFDKLMGSYRCLQLLQSIFIASSKMIARKKEDRRNHYNFKLTRKLLEKYRRSFYQYDQSTFVQYTLRALLCRRKNIKILERCKKKIVKRKKFVPQQQQEEEDVQDLEKYVSKEFGLRGKYDDMMNQNVEGTKKTMTTTTINSQQEKNGLLISIANMLTDETDFSLVDKVNVLIGKLGGVDELPRLLRGLYMFQKFMNECVFNVLSPPFIKESITYFFNSVDSVARAVLESIAYTYPFNDGKETRVLLRETFYAFQSRMKELMKSSQETLFGSDINNASLKSPIPQQQQQQQEPQQRETKKDEPGSKSVFVDDDWTKSWNSGDHFGVRNQGFGNGREKIKARRYSRSPATRNMRSGRRRRRRAEF